MHTAAIIIPRPPVISRYLNASIVVLLCASAPLPVFHRNRLRNHLSDWLLDSLPPKEQPEHLPENKFLRQQRHRHRKNQARHDCHECDHHLHKALLKKGHPNLEFLRDLRGLCFAFSAMKAFEITALLPNCLSRALSHIHVYRSAKHVGNFLISPPADGY